jgi:hypothetical protein
MSIVRIFWEIFNNTFQLYRRFYTKIVAEFFRILSLLPVRNDLLNDKNGLFFHIVLFVLESLISDYYLLGYFGLF